MTAQFDIRVGQDAVRFERQVRVRGAMAAAGRSGLTPRSNGSPELKKASYINAQNQLAARGQDPGAIALIDMGRASDHPDLQGRIVESKYLPDQPSKADHAMQVAGVIAAHCSAPIHHYNVWRTSGLDRNAYLTALTSVIESGVRVLNLSIGSLDRDDVAAGLIRDCINAGVIVIAAMGDYGDDRPVFPAATDGVIAVGACNRHGRPVRTTSKGAHAFIAAPGESIVTVQGENSHRKQDGTSFATPMISAAVWLASRNLNLPDSAEAQAVMRDLLKASVVTPGAPHDLQIGWGALDLAGLANNVLQHA
ncbi:MAG: S8 family peptidase [Longimicrobiales bacterium]